jgi:hypothetical protein
MKRNWFLAALFVLAITLDVQAQRLVEIVDTLPELLTRNHLNKNTVYFVRGRNQDGDGGGGEFVFVAGATDTVNQGTIFAWGNGRLKRKFDGPLNPRWFGAKGGLVDDTAAIQATIDAAGQSGATILFPYDPSGWKWTTVYVIRNNITLDFGGNYVEGTAGPMIRVMPSSLYNSGRLAGTDYPSNWRRPNGDPAAVDTDFACMMWEENPNNRVKNITIKNARSTSNMNFIQAYSCDGFEFSGLDITAASNSSIRMFHCSKGSITRSRFYGGNTSYTIFGLKCSGISIHDNPYIYSSGNRAISFKGARHPDNVSIFNAIPEGEFAEPPTVTGNIIEFDQDGIAVDWPPDSADDCLDLYPDVTVGITKGEWYGRFKSPLVSNNRLCFVGSYADGRGRGFWTSYPHDGPIAQGNNMLNAGFFVAGTQGGVISENTMYWTRQSANALFVQEDTTTSHVTTNLVVAKNVLINYHAAGTGGTDPEAFYLDGKQFTVVGNIFNGLNTNLVNVIVTGPVFDFSVVADNRLVYSSAVAANPNFIITTFGGQNNVNGITSNNTRTDIVTGQTRTAGAEYFDNAGGSGVKIRAVGDYAGIGLMKNNGIDYLSQLYHQLSTTNLVIYHNTAPRITVKQDGSSEFYSYLTLNETGDPLDANVGPNKAGLFLGNDASGQVLKIKLADGSVHTLGPNFDELWVDEVVVSGGIELGGVNRTNWTDVAKAGVTVGTRKTLNLIEGSNVTITATDNPGSDRVDVTIAAAGGGGGAAIENEAFGAAWNGDATNGAAKDNIYAWAHLFDTDDDGLVNALDASVVQTAAANAQAWTLGGYSLTGANAQSFSVWTGTLNTSGAPILWDHSITNTASDTFSLWQRVRAGAAGTTSIYEWDTLGTFWAASKIWSGGNFQAADNGGLILGVRGNISASADGVWRIRNNANALGELQVATPTAGDNDNTVPTTQYLTSNYQPLDTDLTDLADGSLSGSKVGTGIDGGNISTGTVADARIDAAITRDSELVAALDTSLEHRAMMTDENGTGADLFDGATSPSFVTSMTLTEAGGNFTFNAIDNINFNADTDANGSASFRNIYLKVRGTERARVDTDGFHAGIANLAVVNQTGAANTTSLAQSGYSLTGTSTTPFQTWAGTLNGTGIANVFDYSLTITATHANSLFMRVRAGAAGTTSIFEWDTTGVFWAKLRLWTDGDLTFASNGKLNSVSDGVFQFRNNADNAYGEVRVATASANDNDNSAASTAFVQQEIKNHPWVYEFTLSDETTDITTGTAKFTWRAPFAMTITGVRASLSTASSSGNPAIDINEGGVSIFSTTLTIDANERTSTTAATAAVISDSAIADDAEITFDIDTAGTGAKGLKIKIYYTLP